MKRPPSPPRGTRGTGDLSSGAFGARPARGRATPWLVLAALLVGALSFRAPFLSVAPIADDIRDDLGLGSAQIGLLTTIPVLCFGLSAPWATALVRRVGFDVALLVALATVTAGLAVRSAGPWASVLAGSVVIGLGITVGNIVAPAIIRRETTPRHQAVVTSGYTGTMNIGAMAATLSVAPLAAWLGWRWALSAWALVSLLAMVAWFTTLRPRRATVPAARSARHEPSEDPAAPAPPSGTPATSARPVRRTAVGWLLALAFAGQVSAYYSVAAWLPQILRDDAGLSQSRAGAVTSWFQVLAIAGALLLSVALRTVSWGGVTAGIAALWLACPIVLLLGPELHLLAATLGGLAQGAGLTALFVLIMRVSESDQRAAEYSAFMQGTGYVLSAATPFAVGALHEATSGWRWPLLLVIAYLLVFTATQLAAVRRIAARRAQPTAPSLSEPDGAAS
ncbi:CynX/NimT family MFS transporter [Streptomyces sp. AJS327]|uniref:MFS transporter n=1 Tax=Streptomyces sp. AJS327 TaxID=2545265 RepID=UPI0015DDDAF4|nr:MFS transporter [Streptomyces sp. AJS327]